MSTTETDNQVVNHTQPQATYSLSQVRRQSWLYATVCSLSSIAVLAGGGHTLDLLLDKKPIFTIIGFVLAFVVTLVTLIIIGQRRFK